jgi:hypothetical protein
LALFFQIAFRPGLPFSAHSGPFAFELFTFALPQIGFVFSNRTLSTRFGSPFSRGRVYPCESRGASIFGFPATGRLLALFFQINHELTP